MENNNEIIDARLKEYKGGGYSSTTVIVDVVVNGICHRLETTFSGDMVREEHDEPELGKSRQDISFYQNGCFFADHRTTNTNTYVLENYWLDKGITKPLRRFREL
jgi:G:T-mismatch repair DNA endonuclease (very short patch repair protein)